MSLSCTAVGLGMLELTRGLGHALSVDGLGSCVGLLGYARGRWMAAHIVLPSGPGGASLEVHSVWQPVYSARQLRGQLLKLAARGWSLEGTRFALVGGASVIQALDGRDIGPRNVIAVRYVLSSLGLELGVERTGGARSRRVWVSEGSPELHIKSQHSVALPADLRAA